MFYVRCLYACFRPDLTPDLPLQVLQPRQSQRITIIIDLAGVKFRDLVGESVAFLKTSVGMMSKHYPQRSFKVRKFEIFDAKQTCLQDSAFM